ncbi:eukaryotic translation initiation factor 4G [Asparagus officinalis]|uniref:eukaryotic translation initiation factor 4G n=1 Tax=Asparagus officinalis TaxID=4686 RepID=UPI00098E1238|nr:eukaryotic translation initiation factor 4G [Asparagus officinalis]XP_020240924.1 eukaryotic translation initiation factor 4G [Asparagus officinalis]
MSHNQSRFEKSDGQLRKSGGRSGHGRGFSGGGGAGKGGGSGGAAHPHHLSSSSNQPSSSSNRSLKKSGNGQGGGQPRVTPVSLGPDTSANTASLRAVQNGAHGQTPPQGPSASSMPSVPRPDDTSALRTSRALPKAPSSRPAVGVSDSAPPSTPVKGDGTKPFALQFGTISPGIVNGLQIPARTSSAPPNLDEQKRDQARRDSFRAVPTQPIPPCPNKQQPQIERKDVPGINLPPSGESHPPSQAKREVQQQISSAPVPPPPKSAALPIPGISMAMPFQQPPISMQFGGPGPQQMPMTLPIGNAPQVPQHMFVHNLQSHPLPPQAMIHQGQGLGFGPHIGHQLGPQGNLGIGIAAPQFAQQQQPRNFAGPRKATVKITHPETHEEVRLDKRTDLYTDGVSSGQRPINSSMPQSQPITSFTSSHYFPQMQPNSYNPPPIFFPTSTSVATGPQPSRFSYPAGQSGQGISFMNLSLHNSVPVKSEPSQATAPSAPVQGSVKPTAVPIGQKVGATSVTISMPVSKAEQPKLLKPTGEATVIHQQRDSEIPAMTEKSSHGTLSAPVISSGDSGSAELATDGKQREPIIGSDSLKDHLEKPSKKDLRPSQPQQIDDSASEITKTLSSINISKDGSHEDVNEHSVSTQAQTGEPVESKDIPASSSSEVINGEEASQVVLISCSGSGSIPIKEKVPSNASGPEIEENLSKDLESTVLQGDNASLEDIWNKKGPGESQNGRSDEVSEVYVLDSSTAKVHPVPTVGESSEDVKTVVLVKKEETGTNNSEKLTDSADVGRTSNTVEIQDPAETLELTKASSSEKGMLSSPRRINNGLEKTGSHDEKTGSHDVTEVPKDGRASSLTSGPKDKLPLESIKAKSVSGKRKKRKEILSKADAAGTSDLYNAYKGPKEKHELAITSQSVETSLRVDGGKVNADSPDKDAIITEEHAQSIAEVDDWEDAADVSTPEVNDVNKHLDDDESESNGTKKYTRDFLLTFSEHCTDLPSGFEIKSDIADTLMSVQLGSSYVVNRDAYPSPGSMTNRSPGVSRSDRRGSGMMDEDRWTKGPGSFPLRMDLPQNFRPVQGVAPGVLRNPRGQPPSHFVPIFPMQSLVPQSGAGRNNSDGDRWRQNNSRGLMPPPQTPLQVMHKAERKYEVGKVSDEEQAKQRQLKGILNKLTPQNFEKLFQQVKDVNIDNTVTLSGVISQIFDKALMEPTFCGMYANFCFHLSDVLPDFMENNEKITFKRLLLNKCQEEFERGEREQAEADKVEEEGEVKLSNEEREEKRIKARRRMLGNIRLIGELYKKRMLTERIMHECIQKLLGQYENPDEEDLEALCKLMNTIGEQIDHARAKKQMDGYFDTLAKLSTNQKLSSRVRFMLRDVIDLRKNRWQQRRKVEGPKKIEEVHRDAAQERQSQTSRLTRGPGMSSASRRGPPVDYSPRGSSVLPQAGGIRGLPTQSRGGYGMQDVRLEDRHPHENRTLSIPLTQRNIDNSITLGPQGGLAKGMSIRGQPSISNVPVVDAPPSGPNGYNATPERVPYSPREDAMLSYVQDKLSDSRESRITDRASDRSAPTAVPVGKPLSEEVLQEKSISAIREFYSAKDEKEVALCVKELNAPSFYPSMVSLWVTDSFERKDLERDLLATLLVNLCKSRDSLLSQNQLSQGFESVLSSLEDAMNDAPRAAEFLSRIFVKVILENVVPLRDLGKLIHEGGEEPGRLLEIGLASEVLGSVLEFIKVEKGESFVKEILTSSKLRLEDFKPPHPIKSKKLDAFL